MQIVGPALIMLMVGALVFFLIEVFYRGPHSFRLRWVLGLFTFASVLVSRIAVEEGHERASLFGLALSLATLFVTVSLVDFEYGNFALLEPFVVIIFIGVVMWSTNRLTWDCTVIDDSRDVSSIGLTEFVKRKFLGLRKQRNFEPGQPIDDDRVQPSSETTSKSPHNTLLFLFFANSKNKNTPGLWVFYFALAAFPIFGFGQWFAQPSDGWGYRWIFLLFAIYFGSGLGLLMLTSLLGLERYLKKRGASLPDSISRSWIMVGAGFALAVMFIMLLLPSPSLSSGMENALGFLTTRNKNTSQHAVGNDGQNEGENPQGQKQANTNNDGQKTNSGNSGDGDGGKGGKSKSNQQGKDSSGKQSSNEKQSSSKNRQNAQNGNSKNKTKPNNSPSSQKNENAQNPDGNQNQKNEPQSKNDPGNQNNKANKANDPSNSKENPSTRSNNGDSSKNRDDREANKNNGGEIPKRNGDQNKLPDHEKANQAKQARQNQANDRNRQGNNQGQRRQPDQPAQQPASSSSSGIGKFLASMIRFLFYGIGLILLVVVLWMFREELAKLWNELFDRKPKQDANSDKTAIEAVPASQLRGFSQFKEPFSSGLAAKWPASRTIEYTFSALEAWAREHQQPREHDQTPHEFAKQLAQVDADISAEARQLADLLGQSLFSGGSVDKNDALKLKQIWRMLIANSPTQPNAQLASQS